MYGGTGTGKAEGGRRDGKANECGKAEDDGEGEGATEGIY